MLTHFDTAFILPVQQWFSESDTVERHLWENWDNWQMNFGKLAPSKSSVNITICSTCLQLTQECTDKYHWNILEEHLFLWLLSGSMEVFHDWHPWWSLWEMQVTLNQKLYCVCVFRFDWVTIRRRSTDFAATRLQDFLSTVSASTRCVTAAAAALTVDRVDKLTKVQWNECLFHYRQNTCLRMSFFLHLLCPAPWRAKPHSLEPVLYSNIHSERNEMAAKA